VANSSIAKHLVWMDLEMTGLDPDRDRILEIAVLITDGDLDVVAEGGQFPGEVTQVDTLPTAVGLAPVGHQGDAERAVGGEHADGHLSSGRGVCKCPRPARMAP